MGIQGGTMGILHGTMEILRMFSAERILQLRNEENLTIDVIAGRCSLSNLEVYNILQENA